MLDLRITNYKSDGTEFQAIASFDPLFDKAYPAYKRDEGESTGGIASRRPYYEREIRNITFGAGILATQDSRDLFRKLLRSHKIEFITTDAKKKKIYTAYELDIDAEVEPSYLEDSDLVELAYKEIKFIEKKSREFNTWY
jgi:hypothetical protein